MNEQMTVWMLTVAVLMLAFAWTAYEKWKAVQQQEREKEKWELGEMIFNADRAYKYDYEDFDDYADDL